VAERRMFSKEKRKEAFDKSDIPYSFSYKIRKAMDGYPCPICNSSMGRHVTRDGNLIIGTNNKMPTVQHNKPISKGGEHNLNNISVICKSCNVSIRDKETGNLNNDLVKRIWREMNGG